MGVRHTFVAALAAAALAAPATADEPMAGTTGQPPGVEAPSASAPQQAEPAEQAEPAQQARPSAPDGEVARAQFTSEVVDREPTDTLTHVSSDQSRVFFFTELRNFQGQDVSHRWEHDGVVEAEVPFGVAGPRWRVYSSKDLGSSPEGTWTVSVLDAEGRVVARKSFEVSAPSVSAGGEAAAEPAAAAHTERPGQEEPDAAVSGEPAPASPAP